MQELKISLLGYDFQSTSSFGYLHKMRSFGEVAVDRYEVLFVFSALYMWRQWLYSVTQLPVEFQWH